MVVFNVNKGREYTFMGKNAKCENNVGNGCREDLLIVWFSFPLLTLWGWGRGELYTESITRYQR